MIYTYSTFSNVADKMMLYVCTMCFIDLSFCEKIIVNVQAQRIVPQRFTGMGS